MSNHCNAKCYPYTARRQAELWADLERCNWEIYRLHEQAETVKTRSDIEGVMMGLRDWQYEKRLIEAELASGA